MKLLKFKGKSPIIALLVSQ